jgi:hypothetical protein
VIYLQPRLTPGRGEHNGLQIGESMDVPTRVHPVGRSPAGEHVCDLTSSGEVVGIDDAGAVYLAGIVWAEDGEPIGPQEQPAKPASHVP